MKKSSLNLEIKKQSRRFIMKILSCGIDVHYKESNFYLINDFDAIVQIESEIEETVFIVAISALLNL